MQYVLPIYQGDAWASTPDRTEQDDASITAEYARINSAPGVTVGLPLRLPGDATTVRVGWRALLAQMAGRRLGRC
jgi:hypothetical protein